MIKFFEKYIVMSASSGELHSTKIARILQGKSIVQINIRIKMSIVS